MNAAGGLFSILPRAVRLTSHRTVLYDADKKRAQTRRVVMVERFEVALNTPAGRLTTAIDVPTGFIPITAIVPVTRRLGRKPHSLEVRHAIEAGQTISCRMGCAAMLPHAGSTLRAGSVRATRVCGAAADGSTNPSAEPPQRHEGSR